MTNRKDRAGSNKAEAPRRVRVAGKKTKADDETGAVVKLEEHGFPIVAIGASAGGLQAFERFFKHMPPDSGAAFVLVPPFDPSHTSLMTELIQRVTKMPVKEAFDQMKVEPDHVYVIPPNKEMSIFVGACNSRSRSGKRFSYAHSFVLRSLAEDQGERGIGVVLSGTGSDGTPGLRAIRGAGGLISSRTLGTQSMTACQEAPSTAVLRIMCFRSKKWLSNLLHISRVSMLPG